MAINYEEKLDELFIDLPEPTMDKGNTVQAVMSGKILQVGGVLPFSEGKVQHQGRVDVDIRPDNARLAARIAAIYALGIAKKELGSVNKIKRVLRVDGFVACGIDFRDHARVIDGASELFVQIFGPNGKHIRNAVGVPSLPQNACVTLSVDFEIR